MNPNSTKRVGIWIRVSTEDQAQGDSPQHHELRARGYAEAKQWQVVELYDLSGVSGKSILDHPEAVRMLADVRSGHITSLIFSKLARLARNTRELLDIADIFRDHGAGLVSLQESIDTTTPAGRLFYTMLAAMTQWEREEISERVAASVPVRAKLGKHIGGAAPFGYAWQDNQLVIDEKEAPIRKLIFELFSEHKRKKTVARLLNEQGHRTRRGAKFSDTTVDRLLRDPLAKGTRRANYTKSRGQKKHWDLKPEEDWVYTDAPAIVSEEVWLEANAFLDAQRQSLKRVARKPSKHLFSGLVVCQCSGKMYVPSNSKKYTCKLCKSKIPTDDLEAIYEDQLRAFLLSESDIAQYFAQADDKISDEQNLLDALQKEKSEIEKEMQKFYDLYMADQISKEGFGRGHKPLEERFAQLEREIPTRMSNIDFLKVENLSSSHVLDETKTLHSRWPTLSVDQRQQVIETVTDSIIIDSDSVSINFHYLPFFKQDNKATHQHGFIAATS